MTQPPKKNAPIIGMRTIKTVIAICLTALFMRHVMRQNPFFACIGAIVAVETNFSSSLRSIITRNVGTVIGGLLGIIVASFTNNILLISLGIIPLIVISTRMGKQETIVPGGIVYFAVNYLNTMDQAMVYGVTRIFGTFIGSMIGLAVNMLLFPPKSIDSPPQTDKKQD